MSDKDQRTRIKEVIVLYLQGGIRLTSSRQQYAIRCLQSYLEATQNMPPEGENDGSVNEVFWNDMKALVTAWEDMQKTARAFKATVEKILKG